MSSSVLKSQPEKDCVVVTKSHRKSRRKHRKGFKNSNIKKKKLKNLCFKKYNYKATFLKKLKMSSDKTTSNWYWANYKKAFEWQDKHKIAHWKSCAFALLEENRYLLQIINNIQPGFQPELSITHQNLFGDGGHSSKQTKQSSSGLNGFHNSHPNQTNFSNHNGNADEGNSSNANDDIEFEMSEEMIKFFEQSYKHKLHMKQMREKEALKDPEEEVKEIQNNKLRRKTEMEILYGEGASMITGMETAVQLSFDKYCDTKSPKYWPNIPFRL